MNSIRQAKALFLVRFRFILNNIRSKAGIGKIIGLGLAALVMIFSTASASYDLLEAIFKLPFSNLIAEWGVGFLVLYGVFVVFTGDLVSGHTLNTGQMSSDFNYLTTFPISTFVLIFAKLFERLITDYFGILFLLPALIGISCYKAYTLNAFLSAILIYSEISLIIGLLINLVNICLTRYFKPATINNFYSIFGYISAILAFIPFLMFSNFNPSQIPTILEKLLYLQENFYYLMLPIRWVAVPLLHSTPFCAEFGYFSILWGISFFILTILFHLALKNNWFTYVHSSTSTKVVNHRRKLFTGIFWKEWLMLKSDLNLLINAILMPISVIAIEIYFLKQVFSFTSMYTVMNFIWGSITYFSLFGPMNIIGYEGKAISFLELLPITPSQLIKKKYEFWVLIALIIFIPATIITFRILSFDWNTTIEATILTILFTLASVWVTVSLSAIFANYETKVLQQHSSFIGKMAAMFIMSILLPIKTLNLLNFYSLMVFISITYACYLKAQSCIAFRQDKEALLSNNYQMLDCLILFLSFIAIENNLKQFFVSVIPNTNTGIWTWCLSLSAMFFFVLLAKKSDTPYFPKIDLKNSIKIICVSSLSLITTYLYYMFNTKSWLVLKSDIIQIVDFFSIISIIKPIWSIIVFILLTIFMVAIVRRIEENYFNKYSNYYTYILGILLTLLISTKNLMIPVLLFTVILQIFKDKESKHSIVLYSSLIYFSALFFYLIK